MAAFTEEKFFTRGTKFGKDWRISILEDGGAGASERITAKDQFFTKRYPMSNPREFWKRRVFDQLMEVTIRFDPDVDLSFYKGIAQAPDDTYRLKFEYGGNLDVIGSIKGGIVTINERATPKTITLRAKPLTLLKNNNFPLEVGTRSPKDYIQTIGEFTNITGFDLPIYSYNEWGGDALADATDYFWEAAIDQYHFRDYAGSKSEDTPFTYYKALESVIPDGFLLFMANGAWHFMSVPYIAKQEGNNVQRYGYTWNGLVYAQDSSTTVNLRETFTNGNYLLRNVSDSDYHEGIKRITQEYNHKTLISSLTFEPSYVHTTSEETSTESMNFGANGSQRVRISGEVLMDIAETGGTANGTAQFYIKADDYYWNGSSWDNSGGVKYIEVSLFGQADELLTNKSFSLIANATPSFVDGDLEVQFNWGSAEREDGTTLTVEEVEWRGWGLDIINTSQESNSASIEYELTQSQQYSAELSLSDRIFGQGPTPYSNGRITDNVDGTLLQGWGVKGGAYTEDYAPFLMGRILSTQRDGIRVISAELWTEFTIGDVVEYESEYFLIIGGDFNGKDQKWKAYLFQLNYREASDTLTTVYDQGGQPTTGISGSSGSSGATGDLDDRYFRQSQALDELATADIDTALTNLGLTGGNRGLDLKSLTTGALTASKSETTLARYFFSNSAASGNRQTDLQIGNTDTGSYLYAGVNFGSNTEAFLDNRSGGDLLFRHGGTERVRVGSTVDVTGELDVSGAIEGDTLRPDTGKFLSPTSYQFRNAGDTAFRDVEMLGLTATRADFSGQVSIDVTANHLNLYETDGNTDKRRFYISLGGDMLQFLARNDDGSFAGNALKFGHDTGTLSVNDNTVWHEGIDIEHPLNVGHPSFSSGWSGTNWEVQPDGDTELQNLRVRGALRVYEFIAKQLSSIGGTEILSIANAKIEDVDTVNNIITVDNVSGTARTPFKQNDLWIVQVVDINNDLESGGTGSVVYRVYGTVTNTSATDGSLSGDQIEVSVSSGSPDGLSALESQDLIVAYGSSSDANRQSIMYRNVDRSEDNLIMRLQTGVDTFGALQAEANTRVAFGDLNGYADFSSETFGFFAGDNTSDKVTIDANNGVRFLDGSNNIIAQINSNKLTVGDGFEYDAPSNTLDVAGFTVDPDTLYRTEGTNEITMGSPQQYSTSALGFHVGSDASNRIFMGVLGGEYEIFANNNGNLLFRLGSNENRIAGAFFDADSMWAGGGATSNPATKDDASIHFDFGNGTIEYDALSSIIYSKEQVATLGSTGNAPSLTDEFHLTNISSSTNGASNRETKIRKRFYHREGFNTYLMNYLARSDNSGDSTFDNDVWLVVRDIDGNKVVENNNDIGSGTTTEGTLELDVSSLTGSTYYIVEIDLEAQIGTVQSGTPTAESELREDVFVIAVT